MNLPFVPMKATDYNADNVNSWASVIMQPKLRGLCCWLQDGVPHTRKGGCYNVFPAHWFPTLRESIHLIGELWHPNMTQQDIQGAVVRNNFTESTAQVRLYIFDIYDEDQPDLIQDQRLELLNDLPDHPHMMKVQCIYPSQSITFGHDRQYHIMLAQGFEGAIYRHPNGIYIPRTETESVQKRKPWFTSEGSVVGIETSGNGKRAGLLKHFVIEWQGKIFKVGGGKMNNRQLKEFLDLPMGTIITFEYQELTNLGTPAHAQFIAVRTDL